MKIGISGASLDTCNFGVSALAEASIKCLHLRWPQAEFVFVASGRERKTCQISIGQQQYSIDNLPIRFCRNIFLKNHYLVLFFTGMFLRIFRSRSVKSWASKFNPYVQEILSLEYVADITGGDSFTDLYGVRRFFQGGLVKLLWLLYGKPVYFLPQTYGPFKRRWVETTAKFLLKRSAAIMCRDRKGYAYLRGKFASDTLMQHKIANVPDVGFVLDAAQFDDTLTESIELCRREGFAVAGLNVSGLLYYGGYTRDNMFALKNDYRLTAERTAAALLDQNCALIFVPHVFPRSAAYKVESDLEACRLTAAAVLEKRANAKIFIADANYTHNQIKYLIGQCDFFAGSRMHSCIAALSQCVPAVGIAYSDKFKGVFESVGQENYILDAKKLTSEQIANAVCEAFTNRKEQKKTLQSQIPAAKREIYRQFENLPADNSKQRFARIDQVRVWRLCLGCGACVSACPDKNIEMRDVVSRGLRPFLKSDNCRFCGKCVSVCPGVSLSHAKEAAAKWGEWGPILEIWEGYASDPNIRFKGSSGGAATAIATYCLDHEDIAGVLHIRENETNPIQNKAVLSRTYNDLLTSTGSRYSPAAPCEHFDLIEQADLPCVFIGKPCDTAGLIKYQNACPRIGKKVFASISIFCAGTPSTQATMDVLGQMGIKSENVISLRYRGDGWPGKAVAKGKNGTQAEMSYSESWGEILSKHVAFRCRICPDSTGEFGDISCGDPWYKPIENGDPGRSIVIARTETGRRIIHNAIKSGYLTLTPAKNEIVPLSQKSLLNKRRNVWARLRAMELFGIPVPDYRGFALMASWQKLSFKDKLKSFGGTSRRVVQRKWYAPDPQEINQ